MKPVSLSRGLLFLAASASLWPRLPDDARPAPHAVTVTRAGEVVSVGVLSERTLRFSTERGGASAHHDLELDALPEGARLLAVQLGAFVDKGLAALLAIESGTDVQYRYLFTPGDPLRGELVAGDAFAAMGAVPENPWSLSEPLFTSSGEPYRLVEIHNPGGDSLEMTFRRGSMQGIRDRSVALGVDERIIHDVCPTAGELAPWRSTSTVVERLVEAR
jgi:hypothetical protein